MSGGTTVLAIVIELILAGAFAAGGLRQVRRSSQVVSMSLFFGAFLFAAAAIMTLTFLRVARG